jgi:hypothetical protein
LSGAGKAGLKREGYGEYVDRGGKQEEGWVVEGTRSEQFKFDRIRKSTMRPE